MGEWGNLNLQVFNKALLCKWWWKIYSDQTSCWSRIIHYNYLNRHRTGPMYHLPPRNKSLFWAGITLILPPFRSCISKTVKNDNSTLLWFDNWLEGRAPKDLCLDLFNDCNLPWVTVCLRSHFSCDFLPYNFLLRKSTLSFLHTRLFL